MKYLTTYDKNQKSSFIKLHASILISSLTSILGKLITLNEGLLVFERLAISFSALLFIAIPMKRIIKIPVSEFFKLLGVGAILGLHWLLFYGSIKYSNVSIGIICFSSIGFFTAIFEPIILHKKFSPRELLFSLISILGIYFIFKFDTRYRIGIIIGIISTVLAALYSITTKCVVTKYKSGTFVLLYELLGGFVVISFIMPLYLRYFPVATIIPGLSDFMYLLILSLLCTLGLYALQIQAYKDLSAFTVNLSYNLEPIYAIFLAMLIFNEAKELNLSFYIGLLLILSSVILQTLWIIQNKKNPL